MTTPSILTTLTTPPTSPSYWLHSTTFTTLTIFTTPTSLNTSISLTRLTTTLTIQNYTGCADWSYSTVHWRHLLRWLHEQHQLRWLHWLHWLHDYNDYTTHIAHLLTTLTTFTTPITFNYFYFTGTSLAVILTTPILPSIITTLTPSTLPIPPHHWLHSTTKTNLTTPPPLQSYWPLATDFTLIHWLHDYSDYTITLTTSPNCSLCLLVTTLITWLQRLLLLHQLH